MICNVEKIHTTGPNRWDPTAGPKKMLLNVSVNLRVKIECQDSCEVEATSKGVLKIGI